MNNHVFLDIETTGLEIWKVRIVQICLMFGDNIKTIRINPGVKISEGAQRVHNISDEDVKDLPTFSHWAQRIYDILNKSDGYIGYNIKLYDLPILNQELLRCGYELPDKIVIDVLDQVKTFEPDRKLSSVYLRYFGEKLSGAHSADVDVMATKRIMEYIQEKLKN